MRTTLVIGVVTIVAAGIVALTSIARLNTRQLAGRDEMTAQLVEDKLHARLEVAAGSIERIGARAENADPGTDLRSAIGSLVGTDSAVFERVIVVDGGGTVLASSGHGSSVESVRPLPAFRAAEGGTRGFMTLKPNDGGWQLWCAWAPTRSNSRLYVLGQLDVEFVTSALQHAAASDRRVLLVHDGVVLARAGRGPRPDMRVARWAPDSATAGRVTVISSVEGPLEGTYVDLTEVGTMGWRLVVLTPTGVTLRDTWSAVLPPVGILAVGGLVALVAAWSVSVRLVRPLRELERAARVAASGSYVRPISVHEDDEIGRVADVFNQVALRLNALHDLSRLLASAGQVDQVLGDILSAMGHLVGPGVAAIYLYDENRGLLIPAKVSAANGSRAEPLSATDEGWLARALFASEPLALERSEEIRQELPGLGGGFGHALAVPLIAGHERLGVVVALRGADRPLSDAEREMVRTFTAQAAVAVQTSRLFEIESRSRRVAEALRAVAEELVRPDGLEPAMRRIEGIIAELFAAATVSIVVIDRSSVSLAGPPSQLDQTVLAVSLRALRGRDNPSDPFVVDHGHDLRADDYMNSVGAECLLIAPVALETDHGGVIVIAGGAALAGRHWARVARAVSDELALAFDNAYFYERALTRAANLETIFRISQAVGSSLQVNVVLNRVLDVVQKILSAEAVALLDYDVRRKTLTTAMARGNVPSSMIRLELEPGEDLAGHVFTSGQPATLRELHAGMKGLAGDAAANGLHSLIAVPLLARGRSIGVLMVFSSEGHAFTEEDASVLQTFASQAALAIDTARLYSREHEVASVLQSSILPDALPDFEELEAHSVYAPAGADAEIGGDYYDLFRSPSGDIWFAMADVCGKGVHAATRTSMIKYALRAFAAAGLSPAHVLAELNRMVAESGEANEIVTVWVGRLDRDATRLTWANGGHPPGLLRHEDGSLEELSVTGPLLGAIPEVSYDEMEMRVAPGDRVLLFTDGVTEARSGNIFFGDQRVREVFSADDGTEDVAHELLGAVRRFARADLRDDVAALVVSLKRRTAGDGK